MRLIALFAALCLASTAFAADEPRKIDFTQVIMDDDGCPISDNEKLTPVRTSATLAKPECPRPEKMTPPDLTLGMAAYHALVMGEPNLSWEENTRRRDLGKSIRFSKEWPLLPSDLELIKKAMVKLWGPEVIGAANDLLSAPAK